MKTLKKLRELNSGANPEIILKEDVVGLEDGVLEDIEGHLYVETDAISEIDYIIRNRGIYGVLFEGKFYKLM